MNNELLPEHASESISNKKRRRLLKGAAALSPVILTLRSGSALAQISGCTASLKYNSTTPRELQADEVCYIPELDEEENQTNRCYAIYSTTAWTSLTTNGCFD